MSIVKRNPRNEARPKATAATIVALAWLTLAVSFPAQALIVQGYTAQRHDRFYVGADKAFIGDSLGYDFSGIGIAVQDDKPRYATMISPSYFVVAAHWRADPGATMTFFHTNDPNGTFEERTVESGSAVFFPGTTTNERTDLWVGKLATPVSSAVARYAIPQPGTPADFLQHEVIVTGRTATSDPAQHSLRVGRNVTEDFSIRSVPSSNKKGNTIRYFNDDALSGGFDPDEAQVQGGDSGAPVFLPLDNGQLALMGIHWATAGTSITIDSFVPDSFNEIRSIVEAGGEQLVAIPEPTSATALMLTLGTLGLVRRKRRQASVGCGNA